MRTTKAFRPVLEGLEQRWVPATIRLVAGNLYVSNQVNATLTLATTGVAGQVKITDGSSVTVSGVGGLISVTGTNLANTIVIDTTAKLFPGNVLISSGNGGDTVSLTGTVNGNLTVTSGNGDDLFQVTGVAKVGGTVNLNGGLGKNDVTLAANLQVGSDFTATSPNDVTLAGNDLKVGGNVTLNAGTSTVGINLTQTGGNLTVGKALSVTGYGSAADTVDLAGLTTVGGNTTLNLRDGLNTVNLAVAAGSFFGGSLAVYGGVGDDDVTFGADLQVGGNATADLGGGTNTFEDDAATIYNGNLSLVGGNDTNTFLVNGAVVAGNLNVTVGNGTNTTTVTGVPAGTLRYRGGNGDDTLEVLPTAAASYLIDAVFGTGTATLTLNADVTLSGTVMGTGGAYTFNQNGATLTPNLFFINFP